LTGCGGFRGGTALGGRLCDVLVMPDLPASFLVSLSSSLLASFRASISSSSRRIAASRLDTSSSYATGDFASSVPADTLGGACRRCGVSGRSCDVRVSIHLPVALSLLDLQSRPSALHTESTLAPRARWLAAWD
jgi:hypothetical protein